MKPSIYLRKISPRQKASLFQNPKPARCEVLEYPYIDLLIQILEATQ